MFEKLLKYWWATNAQAVKNEIEDRTGQRPGIRKPLSIRMRATEEDGVTIQYAIAVFDGDIVAFITIEHDAPKICYV